MSAGYDRSIVRRPKPVFLPLAVALVVLAVGAAGAAAAVRDGSGGRVEVIVELRAPPAARFAAAARGRAMRRIETAERRVAARIAAVSPSADIRWRYHLVLSGLAVVLPAGQAGRLSELPGVAAVYPSVRYRPLSSDGPQAIGAPAVWGPDLSHGGRGLKIGIIDDGIDQTHPYFDPAGFAMPEGFPKGNTAFTTAKVIVARAFPPPGARWRFAGRPFDPVNSSHGTHVAGIAAGDAGTVARQQPRTVISGVAPLAYLGNYKALTVPTVSGVGLNGNSPEIVAAIEAAVADGMDVINLSLGEPEIDPARDAVAQALDNAAEAGVVPVVAAGNDYLDLGRGSVNSPATAAQAIAVAAVDADGTLAPFSAGGPTALGLLPKPDVAAPGVDVLSSVPNGRFEELSGTSMAAPHVAGAAALLLELHPDWTVAQVKSALVLTGTPVHASPGGGEASSAREGAGLVDLTRAPDPLLSVSPQWLGLGLVDVSGGSTTATASVAVEAAGDAGAWSVRVDEQRALDGVTLSVPPSVDPPAELTLSLAVADGTAEGEQTGFVVLERGDATRRVPFWFRVVRPRLPDERFRMLPGAGTYSGSTTGRPALVSSYRYPDAPAGVGSDLTGPERVFRIDLPRAVANLGVAIVRAPQRVRVQPRILLDADENRLAGATSLPYVANPYLASFLEPTPSAAALHPSPGTYAIVFDGPGRRTAGQFRFRVWIDDVTPPKVALRGRVARGDGRLLATVRDAGSGVDPDGIVYRIDGRPEQVGRLEGTTASLSLPRLRPGRHRLVLRVSDRQEAKNNENVARILPNTTVLTTTFRVLAAPLATSDRRSRSLVASSGRRARARR